MIETIIGNINEILDGIFKGAKIYGLAHTMQQDGKFLPALMSKNGEGKYAGFDDTYPMSLYHKVNTIIFSQTAGGFGDSKGFTQAQYGCAMIVYSDRNRTKMLPDELVMIIQASIPDLIKMEPYRLITISILNVILNDQQVYRAEYGIDTGLPVGKNLFQINYNVVTQFDKNCIPKCKKQLNNGIHSILSLRM